MKLISIFFALFYFITIVDSYFIPNSFLLKKNYVTNIKQSTQIKFSSSSTLSTFSSPLSPLSSSSSNLISPSSTSLKKIYSTINDQISTEKVIRDDVRNIAIIAHVDHGKTTLVDSMLKQSGAFRTNQVASSMDSNDQERERGITILAKNAALMHNGVKINVIDTPGHADFGGEVERIMNMVDGVLLVVDSVDGPKPQTRFVLKKALEKGIKVLLVINKIDRPQARPNYVLDKVFDLFTELGANDEQLDFPVLYASGMKGIAGLDPLKLSDSLTPLFNEILKQVPPPQVDFDSSLQLLVANIDIDEFKGKLGIGRIVRGSIKVGDEVMYGKPKDESKDNENPEPISYNKGKILEIFTFNNLGKEKTNSAKAGDIVLVSGLPDISIGDTIMSTVNPEPLEPITIENPSVRMIFSINKSPLAGKDGKYVQSRVIKERLFKEMEKNIALKVYETSSSDSFEVCGRGQLHLIILIETMRREGYEFMVGAPKIIEKEIDGVICEPYELIDIVVPNEYSSSVIEVMQKRKGELINMSQYSVTSELETSLNSEESTSTSLQFVMPTRFMLGIRSNLLTITRGTIVLDSSFHSYKPMDKKVSGNIRERGCLLSLESGTATGYSIQAAQARGKIFIKPKEVVYPNMIIGLHSKSNDLVINICKQKQLTNMRASGSDEAIRLIDTEEITLDSAIEFIQEDEVVEVTPSKIRMAKIVNKK